MRNICILCMAVLLAFSLCVQATPITVVNPGFEEPAGAGNTWNWNDRDATGVDVITGWSHDVSEDTGTWAGSSSEGSRSTFVIGGGASGPYQDLGHTVVAGETYAFTMDVQNAYGYGGVNGVLVLNAHDGSTRTEIASLAIDFDTLTAGVWNPLTVSLTAVAGDAFIGKSLGIEFNTIDNTSWNGYDNASVTVVPEPATMVLLGLGGLLLRRKRS